ncbi:hypothetical protein OG298_15875 [Streptomyces sp. NBC_01005]|uniref:hypothetical protein n=1 Tax=unclassified Streptomyces TaxID=2593676 RepID=UPI002E2F6D1D|nr:hypothetical protein [Streptomyces sp. NBC_01362]WSW05736.1 hypothetical protein OG298_15875 [Streptomyces sp. NBC_01005]WTC95239.1 hypothetical protein OH736_15880 [Streptomyces sp. NBC_01650]
MNDAYSPVPELNSLKEFQDSLEGQFFAPGFELFKYDKGLDWFCGEAPDAYLDRLIPFAYATSSGSYYALWRCDDRTGLATLPVIFFGDEGDLCIEACNLRELFRLLAAEPDDPEDRARLASPRQRYHAWLQRNFGLTPPDGTGDVDGEVLAEYTRRFAVWVSEFASEDLLEDVLGALDLDVPTP